MSKPFNHFVRFLIEHQVDGRQAFERAWGIGCFIFFAGVLLIPLSLLLGAVILTVGISVPMFQHIRQRLAVKTKLSPIPPEILETWELIIWIGQRRQLNERTHPEFRSLLEDLSADRRAVLDSFTTAPWRERAKTPEGQKAQRDIEAVLRDAIYDAIFIGRHLFRSKGQREATFRQRCQDPTFGDNALQGIRQIRDEVQALRTAAIAASDQSDLRIQIVRQRLNTLVEAEQEIESELGPLLD